MDNPFEDAMLSAQKYTKIISGVIIDLFHITDAPAPMTSVA